MNNQLKIIFMGTPEFSVPTLEQVHNKYGITAVVTVPDKQKGRGRKVIPSPVKTKAEELGIDLIQPIDLKSYEFENKIKSLNPDIIIVIAFRILPRNIFSIPKLASFNIHGSLLPKYRGAAPINHAIINGENKTGLTSFILADKVDTGNIIDQVETEIKPYETAGELHNRLMMLSPEITINTIEKLITGNYNLTEQDENLASPASKLFRDKLKINFNENYFKVVNLINGTSPVPGSWTIFQGKRLKILKAKNSNKELNIGEYFISDNEFLIGCNKGSISLINFQLEGKKATDFNNFIKGYRFDKNGYVS